MKELELEKVQEEFYTEIKDPYGFIYITTNLIDGKRYLGQRKFSNGWQKYLGSGRLLQKAIKKYGMDNFERQIVYTCDSVDELNSAEYDLSVFFDVVNSDSWYNLVYGGGATNGWTHTDDAKIKMSEKHYDCSGDKNPNYNNHKLSGKNNPFYGKTHSEETKKKISEANKNPSIETRQKMSESAKGKVLSEKTRKKISDAESGEKHWNYGKAMKENVKEALSIARKEKCSGIKNYNAHHVYCVNYDKIFGTVKEASEATGVHRGGITACCQYKYKYAGKDLLTGEKLCWLYVEDAIKQGYITQQQLDDYLNELKGE